MNFQVGAIGHENLRNFFVTSVLPSQDDSHQMFDLRQTDRDREVPLAILASPHFFTLLAQAMEDSRRRV